MMNILDLEKLAEQARIADKIAAGVVDDQAYNVVTKAVNESVLVEAEEEVENFLRKSPRLKQELDLEGLLDTVNAAFEGTEEKQMDQKVYAPGQAELRVGDKARGAVSQKDFVNKHLKEPEAVAKSMRQGANDQKHFAKGDEKQTEVNVVDNTAKEEKTPGAKLKDVAKPAVTEAEAPVGKVVEEKGKVPKQDAPKAPSNDDGAEPAPGAEKNVKSKQAYAASVKKDAFGGQKQSVPNAIIGGKAMTENAVKFEKFVKGLDDGTNGHLLEAIIQAFRITR